MQLAERDYFDLEEPVEDYLTSFKIEAKKGPSGQTLNPINFRQLLSHTSGLNTYGPFGRGGNLVWTGSRGEPTAVPEVKEYYKGGLTVPFTPGQEHIFSHTGYAVLGQVIEGII